LSFTRTALAVGTFLAVAAPASAAGNYDSIKMRIPDIPIAAGVIEHETVEECWVSTGRLAEISPSACWIREQYATSDRSHELSRDRSSGALRGESAKVDGTIFSWTAKSNELFVGRGKPGRPATLSFAADRGMWADTIARGWYAPAGEEVRDGRTVVKYVDTDAAPNLEGRDWIYVDKETGSVVERGFDQTQSDGTWRVLERETLPLNAATAKLLEFGDHANANVREVEGEDATIARAAKKAGLKSKTRAKIRKSLRMAHL
jgi:hypothetical protein